MCPERHLGYNKVIIFMIYQPSISYIGSCRIDQATISGIYAMAGRCTRRNFGLLLGLLTLGGLKMATASVSIFPGSGVISNTDKYNLSLAIDVSFLSIWNSRCDGVYLFRDRRFRHLVK